MIKKQLTRKSTVAYLHSTGYVGMSGLGLSKMNWGRVCVFVCVGGGTFGNRKGYR